MKNQCNIEGHGSLDQWMPRSWQLDRVHYVKVSLGEVWARLSIWAGDNFLEARRKLLTCKQI